jgi:hypothetical protein
MRLAEERAIEPITDGDLARRLCAAYLSHRNGQMWP